MDIPSKIASELDTEERQSQPEGTQLEKAEDCIRQAVKRLKGSSLLHLVQSHDPQCADIPSTLAIDTALKIKPNTSNEQIMLTALHDAQDIIIAQKRRNLELQAISILNATYCQSLTEKLAEQKNPKKPKKKLMSDGLPVLLTDDFFLL